MYMSFQLQEDGNRNESDWNQNAVIKKIFELKDKPQKFN